MLFLADIDRDVALLRIFADDHALINGTLIADKHNAPILCVEHAVGGRFAGLGGDKGAGEAARNLALIGRIGIKNRIDDALSAGIRQKLAPISEQTSCRDQIFDSRSGPMRGWIHVDKLAFSRTELFHHGAAVFVRHVDIHALDRLAELAVDLLIQYTGRADAKLIALAAHILDQNGKVHFPASRYLKAIRRFPIGNAERNVLQKLLVKPLAKLTGGHKLSLLACKRTVVDGERHLHGRLADLDKFKRLGTICRGDRISDGNILRAGKADDIAHFRFRNRNAAKPVDLADADDFCFLGRFIFIMEVADHDFLILAYRTSLDASDSDSADIIVIVDGGHKKLQRRVDFPLGSGNIIKNGIEQGS